MPYSLNVKNLDKVQSELARRGQSLQDGLQKPMNKVMFHLHENVPAYPAPPSNSTYRRTTTLGHSITTAVKPLGDVVQGAIGTNVKYAPYVISKVKLDDGRGPQADIHKGRWWTLQEYVKGELSEIRKIFEDWVNSVIR